MSDETATSQSYPSLAVLVLGGWVVILACIAVKRYFALASKPSGSVYSLPAGPPRWPLLGNIPGMILAGSSSKYMADLVERYGPTFTLYMGPRPVVVLNTYDSMKDALTDGHLLSNRGSLPALDEYFNGRGIVGSQYTGNWQKIRSFVIRSFRDLGVNRQCFEGVIASQAESLVDFIKATFGENPVDPLVSLQSSVCNVICGVVFAKQYDYENPRFKHLLQTLHKSLRAIEYAAVSSLVPGLHYLPGCSYKTFYSCMDLMLEFFREEIHEHDLSHDPDNPRDVIDMYLTEIAKTGSDAPPAGVFTMSDLEIVVSDLFMAGTETTANVLHWGLLLVTANHDVQDKVHAEIDDVTLNAAQVTMSDADKMPYTKAAIDEILRYASVAISALRSTTSDMMVNDYHIEVDTWIMMNYEYASFDPETWPEPRTFRPERFLDAEGEYRPDEHLISFSIGKRNCLGERLARMELFIFFTNLLKQFDVVVPPGSAPLRVEAVDGGMTRVPHSYQVCFKSRTTSTSSD